MGEGEAKLVSNEVELPLKHRELSLGEPPKALQKSVSDCQISMSREEDTGSPANGEFSMETLLQESQTRLQKFGLEFDANEEVDELLELHSVGTVPTLGPVSNNWAENGSHL